MADEFKMWGEGESNINWDDYIDDGREEGEEPSPEPSIAKYVRKEKEFLATLKNKGPGRCGHCNVRMMLLTATIYKKRQRVGAICPVCYCMDNWLGGLIDGQRERD